MKCKEMIKEMKNLLSEILQIFYVMLYLNDIYRKVVVILKNLIEKASRLRNIR